MVQCGKIRRITPIMLLNHIPRSLPNKCHAWKNYKQKTLKIIIELFCIFELAGIINKITIMINNPILFVITCHIKWTMLMFADTRLFLKGVNNMQYLCTNTIYANDIFTDMDSWHQYVSILIRQYHIRCLGGVTNTLPGWGDLCFS